MQPTLIFDVNETLLDLAPIRTWFTERFTGRPDARSWFGELLRLSFVSAATGAYQPFTTLAGAALRTVAHAADTSVSDDDLTSIAGMFTVLPAHDDVVAGLDRLRGEGFAMAALTNSPRSTATAQLDNAGLSPYLDTVMSVDMVERFKPHPAVYTAAARELGVGTASMVMVAAHDWDIAGAMAAGCAGAFISRPGQTYSAAFPDPTLSAPDIASAADRIIERYR